MQDQNIVDCKDDFCRSVEAAFGGAADLNVRPLRFGGVDCVLYFVDGLTAGGDISEYLIKPLSELGSREILSPEILLEHSLMGTATCAAAEACPDPETAVSRLLNGFCLLAVPGAGAAVFEVKGGDRRGVAEPEVESTTRGPKDAFTETARTNTALLRRHFRGPELRLYETVAGARSRTNVSLLWIDGLTDPETVVRMKNRLDTVSTEDLLTPAAVETVLTGRRRTPFPLLQATERTDKFAHGLLGGRVGIFVDGLPVGYLAPVSLGDLLQSAEDRDTDFLSARLIRSIRLLSLLSALLLPGLYVAMAAFHQEMLPTLLLQAVIESKKNVPFPTVLEILGLLAAFEILQEAGLSAPKAISQPVSIIGGLVVGTAAVEANLISPAALILVSASGICGFALPGKAFADAIRLCRFALTVCAALAGLFGLTAGLIALLVHLASVDSFDRAFLAPFSELKKMKK